MKDFGLLCLKVFNRAITDYHVADTIITVPEVNPYSAAPEGLLYLKCWIDTAQWHMEDEVRRADINAAEGFAWKKQIDMQNQLRTDTVEQLDDWFIGYFSYVPTHADAKLNTESVAWAIDRLSILALKIYHMREQAARLSAGDAHIKKCKAKLDLLLDQKDDLVASIDELLADIAAGRKRIKVYRQVKMYNDAELNPALYKQANCEQQ